MNIEQMELSQIETILEGRISKNPNRFEAANGIVFVVNEMDDEVEGYFSGRGVEIYNLEGNVYYTETIMSCVEFGNLTHVASYHRVA